MTTTSQTPGDHRVVSRDEWLRERIALLAEEKEHTRQRDALARKVRALPWVKLEQDYTFEGPEGPATLADLFGNKSQLVVYHFMFDPTWSQGCKSCSFIADHYNGIVVHLTHHHLAFVTISKAPIGQIEAFRQRMGWSFPWYSGAGNDFGRDFGVSYTDQDFAEGTMTYNYTNGAIPIRELPGLSVFFKDDAGTIYHTYSVFARGLEDFLTAYRYIDITPIGRAEEQVGGMGWLRHHDRYGDAAFVDPWAERPGITSPLPVVT